MSPQCLSFLFFSEHFVAFRYRHENSKLYKFNLSQIINYIKILLKNKYTVPLLNNLKMCIRNPNVLGEILLLSMVK